MNGRRMGFGMRAFTKAYLIVCGFSLLMQTISILSMPSGIMSGWEIVKWLLTLLFSFGLIYGVIWLCWRGWHKLRGKTPHHGRVEFNRELEQLKDWVAGWPGWCKFVYLVILPLGILFSLTRPAGLKGITLGYVLLIVFAGPIVLGIIVWLARMQEEMQEGDDDVAGLKREVRALRKEVADQQSSGPKTVFINRNPTHKRSKKKYNRRNHW